MTGARRATTRCDHLVSVPNWNMLQPEAKVCFLVLTGRVAEAVKLLRASYKDTSVDQDRLDSILLLLAYSEVQD